MESFKENLKLKAKAEDISSITKGFTGIKQHG